MCTVTYPHRKSNASNYKPKATKRKYATKYMLHCSVYHIASVRSNHTETKVQKYGKKKQKEGKKERKKKLAILTTRLQERTVNLLQITLSYSSHRYSQQKLSHTSEGHIFSKSSSFQPGPFSK